MRRADLSPSVVSRLTRYPPPHEPHYGVIPAPPIAQPIALGDSDQKHKEALAALERADRLGENAKHGFSISRLLTRVEAVSSSAMEGTNSTLDELLSIEETGSEYATTTARQVKDYATALEHVIPSFIRERSGAFDIDLIRNLHRAVMLQSQDYRDEPGALRDVVVWIGGRDIAYSTYNPPPPAEVHGCLLDTICYLKNADIHGMQQSLIARMAVAHAHFEAVHPFRDGNGRVGRLLLPLMLVADGHAPVYLSPYIEANKPTYYQYLRDAQQRLDFTTGLEFFSRAITETVQEVEITVEALAALKTLWLSRRHFRRGSASARTLDILYTYPILTAPRLASLLHISSVAANDAVSQLVESGILLERTGYRRNRLYAATEVLRIMNRPFGEAPSIPGHEIAKATLSTRRKPY